MRKDNWSWTLYSLIVIYGKNQAAVGGGWESLLIEKVCHVPATPHDREEESDNPHSHPTQVSRLLFLDSALVPCEWEEWSYFPYQYVLRWGASAGAPCPLLYHHPMPMTAPNCTIPLCWFKIWANTKNSAPKRCSSNCLPLLCTSCFLLF